MCDEKGELGPREFESVMRRQIRQMAQVLFCLFDFLYVSLCDFSTAKDCRPGHCHNLFLAWKIAKRTFLN